MPHSDELFEGSEMETLESALGPLRNDCQEAIELDQIIKENEALVKSMKSRLHELRTKIIPDRMAEAGVGDTFSTADGWKIKIGQIVMGNLPKAGEGVLEDDDPRENAINELIRLGGESLIKNTISLQFPKGEHDKAMEAKEALEALGYEGLEIEETVNAQSYKAFGREAFNNEESDVNMEKLGLSVMPQAKLTPPKDKK